MFKKKEQKKKKEGNIIVEILVIKQNKTKNCLPGTHPKRSVLLCFEKLYAEVSPACADTFPGAEWLSQNHCVFYTETPVLGRVKSRNEAHAELARNSKKQAVTWKMQKGTRSKLWAAPGKHVTCWVTKGDHFLPRSVSCVWRDWRSLGLKQVLTSHRKTPAAGNTLIPRPGRFLSGALLPLTAPLTVSTALNGAATGQLSWEPQALISILSALASSSEKPAP